MIIDRYSKLHAHLNPEWKIPENFFQPESTDEKCCMFLLSCLKKDSFLYLDDSFETLTGYSSKQIIEGGMDFWFSLAHPKDMELASKKIIEAHKLLLNPDFDKTGPAPLVLIYRIRHANGNWVWIKDTKFLVAFTTEKVIDKVLGKFEEIQQQDEDMQLKEILREEESCAQLLEFALVHENSKQKQELNPSSEMAKVPSHVAKPPLTKREKQILQLIGEGLSTKMIAEHCHISISTVETHRRHLLEKLNVKNSMELIKEASKIFWL
jgi:DNA-binding CsgD family transcriptional regulator